jgi:GH43 family beta-xylosidase
MHSASREGESSWGAIEKSADKARRRSRLVRIVGSFALAAAVVTCTTSFSDHAPKAIDHLPSTYAPFLTPPRMHIPPPNVYGEQMVESGLADPNVYKQSNNSFYLSGTGKDTHTIPIYHSTNLRDFSPVDAYDPSALDPNSDYCNLWAPDITQDRGGKLQIFFTAERMAEGQSCENTNNHPRIYYATSNGNDTHFGSAHRIDNDGCLPESCNNIDPEIVQDRGGRRLLRYAWFGRGQNVISEIDIDNPSRSRVVAMPTYTDGTINEAPDVFERNGKDYMLYSRNFFDADYGLSYIQADSIADLTRARQQSLVLTSMIRGAGGRPIENRGHSSVVERNGKYYIFYHKGSFDSNGELEGRSTNMQQLHFDDHGTIKPLDVTVPQD